MNSKQSLKKKMHLFTALKGIAPGKAWIQSNKRVLVGIDIWNSV